MIPDWFLWLLNYLETIGLTLLAIVVLVCLGYWYDLWRKTR